MTPPHPSSDSFRFELRSAEHRAALAAAPLPLGVIAGAPRHSMHRDLYLDTADETLRERGITCRLRFRDDDVGILSLRFAAEGEEDELRLEARVESADVAGALAESNAVTRRLSALVDPALLQPRLELEVDRLTRVVDPDLLRRPRVELHYDRVTVRRQGVGRTFHQLCGHRRRGEATALHRLAAALEAEHGLRALGGDRRDHAGLLLRWAREESGVALGTPSDEMQHELTVGSLASPELLNPELSLLAFQRRVLALAEDPATPLRARLRFLGIVTSNLDELYMGRIPELRRHAREDDAAHDRGADGMNAIERLVLVERAVTELISAQARCAEQCLRDAAALGVQLLSWDALDAPQREVLRARCRDEINPGLTLMAMTLSPGHPLPHLPHLGLFLAVVFRRAAGAEPHLAELELPDDAPRLLPVPGRPGAMIAIEEVLRANLDLLYPNAQVDGAYLFRVTRGGELALDEEGADDLLEAVALAAEQRPGNPAVRVEVEQAMPTFVGELVLESLRRDAQAQSASVVVDEVQVVDGLLDLRCLGQLPLPAAEGVDYPAMRGADAVVGDSFFDAIRQGDLLVHHPFESFEGSVERFILEAVADPQVTSIKITLYRVGEPSRIVEALIAAAQGGKRVAAMVELKARFDETRNVSWARALERAGGHVVYGLVGLKVHAKVALVVRREEGKLRQYVHVGTGNYSARSGRDYTDLSLFSAREALTADVADLFNELTGSARAPRRLGHGALVAPHQLLPALSALIERETANARAGQPAGIRIKVNGLSDAEIIRALYRASEAGVKIELVVRGICTLRPGIAGRSDNIRVVSVVGRFLEHSRIYRFENGGSPEYLIGSSDLRPRNLRRRVELLVPVVERHQQRSLDRILELYLGDSGAWELRGDGSYARPVGGPASSTQVVLSEMV